MKKLVLRIAMPMIVLFAACGGHDGITFEGSVANGGSRYLVLSRVGTDGNVLLDSVKMDDGHFTITTQPSDTQPAFYLLSLSEYDAFTLPARQGDKLSFTATAGRLAATYHVQGSPDAQRMEQLDRRLTAFADSTDRLLEAFELEEGGPSHEAIETKYLEIKQNHTQFLRQFIQQNAHSLTTLPAFYQHYNQAVFLDEMENLELLKSMKEQLRKHYAQNDYVKWLSDRIAQLEKQKTLTHNE